MYLVWFMITGTPFFQKESSTSRKKAVLREGVFMLSRIGNRKKIILSMLFMVLLIWGVPGVSYGQELSVSLLGPSTVQSGSSFNLTATISNIGQKDSAATTFSVSRYIGPSFSSGTTEISTRDVTVIAGGRNLSFTNIQLTAPSTAAIYRYKVSLAVASPDTDANNTASVDINVQSSVNLTISSNLSVSPSQSAVPGGYITLTASVSNTGGAASPSTTFNVYLSNTGATTDSGTFVTSFTSDIPANDTGRAVSSPLVLVPTIPRTYYYSRTDR